MRKSQPPGVKAEARECARSANFVAHDRMANELTVDPELVCASCDGFELEQRCFFETRADREPRFRIFTVQFYIPHFQIGKTADRGNYLALISVYNSLDQR